MLHKTSDMVPTKRLNQIDITNENAQEQIEKRLLQLKYDYVKKYFKGSENDDNEMLEYDRKAIPINLPYASECNLWYENNVVPFIKIGLRLGSKGSQYWALKDKIKKDSQFKERLSNAFVDKGEYKIQIEPYLKISDSYGRYVFSIRIDLETLMNNPQCDELIGRFDKNKDTGRWERRDVDYVEKVKEIFSMGNELTEKLSENFSKRNRFLSTIEYRVQGYIRYEKAEELEKDSNGNGILRIVDEVVDYVS